MMKMCKACGKPLRRRDNELAYDFGRRILCDRRCMAAWKAGVNMTREEFFKRVITEPNTGCWIWSGAWNLGGYGRTTHDNEPIRAHRASWLIHNGPVPDGLFVLHRCDVRACVNPAHLWLGTQQDNMDDMIRKGRQRPGGHEYGAFRARRAA